MRTVLVHLNVELPDDALGFRLSDDVATEIRGALEVGIDPENTPLLALNGFDVALAEEV
jgi:hypothetical protein